MIQIGQRIDLYSVRYSAEHCVLHVLILYISYITPAMMILFFLQIFCVLLLLIWQMICGRLCGGHYECDDQNIMRVLWKTMKECMEHRTRGKCSSNKNVPRTEYLPAITLS